MNTRSTRPILEQLVEYSNNYSITRKTHRILKRFDYSNSSVDDWCKLRIFEYDSEHYRGFQVSQMLFSNYRETTAGIRQPNNATSYFWARSTMFVKVKLIARRRCRNPYAIWWISIGVSGITHLETATLYVPMAQMVHNSNNEFCPTLCRVLMIARNIEDFRGWTFLFYFQIIQGQDWAKPG